MCSSTGDILFYLVPGFLLIVLPGLAVLRLVAGQLPSVSLLSRITIAPGITIAVIALSFVWCDLCHLHPGPALPWILLIGAVLILVFVRQNRVSFPRRKDVVASLKKTALSEWLAAAALVGVLTILLVVRLRSTWDWCVPPGIDTAQHTVITQLLIEHNGLFKSWAPYADAEAFTYHFGFHAVAATFAWLSGLDGATSVLIMSRVLDVVAAASLFAVVQLWSRSNWGGVFAVVSWLIYSSFLLSFDITGRSTLLAGLTTLSTGLVLLSHYLQPEGLSKSVGLGSVCALVAGGIIVVQYKSALIFAVLAGILFISRGVTEIFRDQPGRLDRLLQISYRTIAIATLAFLLAAPRLATVMEARVGRMFKRIVIEAPAASMSKYDKPTLDATGIVQRLTDTHRKAAVLLLAVTGAILAAIRRRRALWFVIGWIIVTLVMNPALIGNPRAGVIDETHWLYAVETALAVMAGLTIGLICEFVPKRKSRWLDTALAFAAVIIMARATVGLTPVPDLCRYVMPEDVRVLNWIRQNVPGDRLIAGRGFFNHGEILGRDALVWLPYFTSHWTNASYLAAALDNGPWDERQKARDFTVELYKRDMSTPESAKWLQEQGFDWFYVGALEQDKDANLLDQLARNPGLEVARSEGLARLYHVK